MVDNKVSVLQEQRMGDLGAVGGVLYGALELGVRDRVLIIDLCNLSIDI